jgi:Fic family protein
MWLNAFRDMKSSNNKWKAGQHKKQHEFSSFLPEKVNQSFKWNDPVIDVLLADAMRYLGELNAYSTLVPDVDFFIQMHVVKEATVSSRIEGTKTNIDEALLSQEEVGPEERDDWGEVQNYIAAINHSVAELAKLPLSMRLINKAHEILLSGVRGYRKLPGEVRRSQNWIGGSTIRDAVFVPPHPEDVPELLSDLERYWHNKSLNTPDLIKAAITHYQFETIHPYLDGNGRIGRLLITLQLVSLGIIEKPTLYISDFFEKNRVAYYDALSRVRASNDLEHWIRFFFTGIATTAKDGKETFEKIIALRAKYEALIENGMGTKRHKTAKDLLKQLFSKPVVTVRDMEKMMSTTFQTASIFAKEFERIGIFTEKTGFSQNRVFYMREYLDLFKK